MGQAWARSEPSTRSVQNDEANEQTAFQGFQLQSCFKGQNSLVTLWRRFLIANGPNSECFADAVSFIKAERGRPSETYVLIGLQRRLGLASNPGLAWVGA